MQRASEANRRYFREAYRTGNHGWETDEPSPYAVNFLNQLAQVIPRAVMLDLGCGEGRHAIAAAKLGFKVVGIDTEPLALQRAQTRVDTAGLRDICFQRGSAYKLPFSPAAFDMVLDYGNLKRPGPGLGN